MIFDAKSFSKFELCPRLPQLERTFNPPRLLVREAVKLFLESGIRRIMARLPIEEMIQSFLSEAASPGFIYPEGEAFTLVQDHASWLDGALRLIEEEFQPMEQLPLYRIGEHHISVEGWTDGEEAHIFRCHSTLGARELRWPELALTGLDGRAIAVHVYRLPQCRNGRLLSPLSMAYKHPSFANIQYRLAKIDGDKNFKSSWKKEARWEIQPPIEWREWRQGIERDKCLDAIRETYTINPTLDDSERDRLIFDIEQMVEAQNRPSIFPRYRERCSSCSFKGLCHGSAEDRSEYAVNQGG